MSTHYNNSKKREAVLKELKNTKAHPSAEMLMDWMTDYYPDLSLGTIYRNLSILVKLGKVKSLGIINGRERFDARIDDHQHFVCEKCGQICDLDINFGKENIFKLISSKYDYLPKNCDIIFNGICNKCR